MLPWRVFAEPVTIIAIWTVYTENLVHLFYNTRETVPLTFKIGISQDIRCAKMDDFLKIKSHFDLKQLAFIAT